MSLKKTLPTQWHDDTMSSLTHQILHGTYSFWSWYFHNSEIKAILWIQNLIIMLTRARHLSLLWDTWIKSTIFLDYMFLAIDILSYFKTHFNNIFPSKPRYSNRFPSGLPTKSLYEYFFFRMRSTFIAQPILFYLIAKIIFNEDWKSRSSWLCGFHRPPVTSFTLTKAQ